MWMRKWMKSDESPIQRTWKTVATNERRSKKRSRKIGEACGESGNVEHEIDEIGGMERSKKSE
jgi:hypothetical protein